MQIRNYFLLEKERIQVMKNVIFWIIAGKSYINLFFSTSFAENFQNFSIEIYRCKK